MEISNEQLALVNERIAQLLHADSFYGKRLREHGIDGVSSPEDFKKLPFSEKKDLRDAYPLGLMSVPEEKIVRMHSSSGTTGKPVIIRIRPRMSRTGPRSLRVATRWQA